MRENTFKKKKKKYFISQGLNLICSLVAISCPVNQLLVVVFLKLPIYSTVKSNLLKEDVYSYFMKNPLNTLFLNTRLFFKYSCHAYCKLLDSEKQTDMFFILVKEQLLSNVKIHFKKLRQNFQFPVCHIKSLEIITLSTISKKTKKSKRLLNLSEQ